FPHHAVRQSGDGRGLPEDPHRPRLPPLTPRRAGPSRRGELLVTQAQGQQDLTPEAILERARARGRELGLPYAGAVTPPEAWALQRAGAAQLVDVRTAAEDEYVGRV